MERCVLLVERLTPADADRSAREATPRIRAAAIGKARLHALGRHGKFAQPAPGRVSGLAAASPVISARTPIASLIRGDKLALGRRGLTSDTGLSIAW
ncbi:hypothetical protein ACVIGB_006941 [Bradyrhizobium sp. USDA 4341]